MQMYQQLVMLYMILNPTAQKVENPRFRNLVERAFSKNGVFRTFFV